jgi:hypothetical protein
MEERPKRGRKKKTKSTKSGRISEVAKASRKKPQPLGPDLESAMREVRKIAAEIPRAGRRKRRPAKRRKMTNPAPKPPVPEASAPAATVPAAPEPAVSVPAAPTPAHYVWFKGDDRGAAPQSAADAFAMKLAAAMRSRMSGPEPEMYARPVEAFIADAPARLALPAPPVGECTALVPMNGSKALVALSIPAGAVVEKMCGKMVVMQPARDFLSGRTMVAGEHVCAPGVCEYVRVCDVVASESECESIARKLEHDGILSSDLSDAPEAGDIYVCSVGGAFHDCRSDRCADCGFVDGSMVCWKTGIAHGAAYTGSDPNQFRSSTQQERMSGGRSRRLDDLNAQREESLGWHRFNRAPGGGIESCRRSDNQTTSAPWVVAEAEAVRRARRAAAAPQVERSDPTCDGTEFGDEDGGGGERTKEEAWEDGPPVPDKRRRRKVKRATSVGDPAVAVSGRMSEVIDSRWAGGLVAALGPGLARAACERYAAALEPGSPIAAQVAKEVSMAETVARMTLVDLPGKARGGGDSASAWNTENVRTYSRLVMRAWILACATQGIDRLTNVMLVDIARYPSNESATATSSVQPPPAPSPKFSHCALGAIYLTITGYEVRSDIAEVAMSDEAAGIVRSELLSDCGADAFSRRHRITFVSLNTYLASKLVPEIGVSKAFAATSKGRSGDSQIRIDSQTVTAGRSIVQERFREISTWSLVKLIHDVVIGKIPASEALKEFDSRSSCFRIDGA